MIHFNSYLHRAEFYDLIRRWMYDDLISSDAGRITRLVHFNNTYISRYLHRFSTWIFKEIHGNDLVSRRVRTKAELKDAICVDPPTINRRVEQLIQDYREHPEHYYRETPFHGTLFFKPQNGSQLYVGSNRIKRVRRLAEKSARRIIDRIFEAIKLHAEALADDRARSMGISREKLLTQPGDMLAEFLWAEKRMQEDLKNHRPIPVDDELVINDVAGIKVLLEKGQQDRVLELLRGSRDCEITEVEPHRGNYNATNVLITYRPDKQDIIAQPLSQSMLGLMHSRGLDPEPAQAEFQEFVLRGESQVTIEVIVSDYQEMMESEIGRCMHEDRIIEQRLRQEYRGHLSKNVEYLMEYMFAFAVSRRSRISELPIKLWNRYLPDTYEEVIKALYNIPSAHLDV
jgi:hypothetical protein